MVNSSQGGGSEDTWVLAPALRRAARELEALHRLCVPLPQPLYDKQWTSSA